jgi:hypothetical protein
VDRIRRRRAISITETRTASESLPPAQAGGTATEDHARSTAAVPRIRTETIMTIFDVGPVAAPAIMGVLLYVLLVLR